MNAHLTKFQPETLAVKEWAHWIATVRVKQLTPGCLVVLPKRELRSFTDVSEAEGSDLIAALAELERWALDPVGLGADRINVVGAMMKDPFVHFHFIPRFQTDVNRFGEEWHDADWPKVVSFRDVETESELLERMRDAITIELN